jgi:hypothetical protein
MEPKQQRLNFSDYSARQQEIDAARSQRRQTTDVYVMRVNGDWGAVMPRKRHNVVFNADKGVELPEFVQNVRDDLVELGIKPRFHCVQNFGIECKIAEHQDDFAKLRAMKEFNER